MVPVTLTVSVTVTVTLEVPWLFVEELEVSELDEPAPAHMPNSF